MFDLADSLPQKYQFSLGEQLRRAALSIPTNLAEGSGRDNPKEERCFYGMAKGSVYEVVSLLVITGKRGCLAQEMYREHYREADELAAMTYANADAGYLGQYGISIHVAGMSVDDATRMVTVRCAADVSLLFPNWMPQVVIQREGVAEARMW